MNPRSSSISKISLACVAAVVLSTVGCRPAARPVPASEPATEPAVVAARPEASSTSVLSVSDQSPSAQSPSAQGSAAQVPSGPKTSSVPAEAGSSVIPSTPGSSNTSGISGVAAAPKVAEPAKVNEPQPAPVPVPVTVGAKFVDGPGDPAPATSTPPRAHRPGEDGLGRDTPPAPPITAPPVPTNTGVLRSEIAAAINAERAALGLPSVTMSHGLGAQCEAVALMANPSVLHPHLNGSGCQWGGEQWGDVMEVTTQFNGTSTDAVINFMQSQSHRNTLMVPGATHIQVGVVCNADGRLFVAVLVLDRSWSSGSSPGSSHVTNPGSGSTCTQES